MIDVISLLIGDRIDIINNKITNFSMKMPHEFDFYILYYTIIFQTMRHKQEYLLIE